MRLGRLYTTLNFATSLTKVERNFSLCIKGASNEDAVLCTPDTTYNLRSVVLSNSVLVTTPSTGSHPALEIRDELHEILELTPCVPKLHRLKALLKGLDYGENAEDDDLYGEEEPRQVSKPSLSLPSQMFDPLSL